MKRSKFTNALTLIDRFGFLSSADIFPIEVCNSVGWTFWLHFVLRCQYYSVIVDVSTV